MNISEEDVVEIVLERAMLEAIRARPLTAGAMSRIVKYETERLLSGVSEGEVIQFAKYVHEIIRTLFTDSKLEGGISDVPTITRLQRGANDVPTTPEAVGSKLRELRMGRDITQAELAERAEVEPANLSRIERGQATPNISTVLKILSAMGCTLQDLR